MNEEIKAKLIGYLSRHVVLAMSVIACLFYLKFAGKIAPEEIPFWYECVKWCLGLAIGGHAVNKYVDGKNKTG